MNTKNIFRLRLMYWYNIIVTGGFACIICSITFFPSLRNVLAWQGTDPIIASFVIPLFVIMSLFCIQFLKKPEEGILLLKIQVCYKPVAIVFILYFLCHQKIHPFWGILIITGLLLYIVGNMWAIPWKDT
jgi:hypothetical protein